MSTGYESYVTIRRSDPATALTQANLHLQTLMEQKRPRVGDAGASHDSSTLDADIERVLKDIENLEKVVYRIGVPQMVPVRRVY